MKKIKNILLACTVVLTLGVFVGCSQGGDSKSEGSETRKVQTVKGEVEIPKDPKKIVDISGSSEELVLLGYTPVGTANVDSYETDKVPAYVKDKLGSSKVVGHSMMDTMDVESIIELQPDLIIMSPRQEKIYDQLKSVAPVVMLEDKSNDWEAKFKDVAKLFDKENEAQKWLDEYYKKAKNVGDEIKKANGDETYLAVLATSGQFMVFTEGGIGTVLKEDMGLKQPKNMPKQDSITLPTVSLEGLTKIDADNLIVIGTKSELDSLKSNSVWNKIKAVKNSKVTELPASPYFSQAYNPIGREILLDNLKEEIIKK
ncbi:MAG: iron-hydroxamate ABC transporter substrate-binding protein [Clostridium sp.]|uniref:iron-hydroxamate ABC transporter substrate-binding protein n=1 Tax=Clostridium TaxID=1485 RepID=UPI002152AC03|nr:iron-hydroxamate ABC transporter substrate-binding protein [Clostridium sp. LY3-2]MCR6514036.1 iron-hydroxamate ABC transporter substrate-binding protein [Clostridium sp. LY3-2]